MPTQSTANRWKRLTQSRFVMIVGSGLVLILLIGIVREFVHRIEIQQQVQSLENEIKKLEGSKTKLTTLIDDFSSPLFQEQEAREKLGKAKPGETVVIVPLTNTTQSTDKTAQDTGAAPQQSNPKKWWRYFFTPTS